MHVCVCVYVYIYMCVCVYMYPYMCVCVINNDVGKGEGGRGKRERRSEGHLYFFANDRAIQRGEGTLWDLSK